jgi:two-component system response regulator QseB
MAGLGSAHPTHRILIVEDDPMTLRLLSAMLRAWGHEVSTAATLHAGLNQVDRATHLILDLMLPDGNGVRILERIRAKGLAVKVAVITAESGTALLEAGRYQPDLVLQKPVDVNKLLSWLIHGSS